MSHSEEATLADPREHLRIVPASADSASDSVDPRITPRERADEEQLDEPYLHQLSDYVHHREHTKESEKTTSDDGPLYVGQVLTMISYYFTAHVPIRSSLKRETQGIH